MSNSKSIFHPLLIGEKLMLVEFGLDFVNLNFLDGGKELGAYNFPLIKMGGTEWKDGILGYRDTLCSFLWKVVTDVSVSDEVLELIFGEHGSILIFVGEDYCTPEAAEYTDDTGKHIVWN